MKLKKKVAQKKKKKKTTRTKKKKIKGITYEEREKGSTIIYGRNRS